MRSGGLYSLMDKALPRYGRGRGSSPVEAEIFHMENHLLIVDCHILISYYYQETKLG